MLNTIFRQKETEETENTEIRLGKPFAASYGQVWYTECSRSKYFSLR